MLYGMMDIGKNMLGLKSSSQELRKDEFWAVKDVSFEVKKGETLGIIGPNGSGKTTLLKMLNGIFWPDKGRITIKGRVGVLIAVGAGFHPMLTGRENIYVNGAILGMSKREIDKKFDSIVEFADIGDFLDTPVKHYSSGMFVRLGFAIAVHCEPDILLVDEVLAVGDVAFREKCLQRMNNIRKEGKTIIFVSHSLYQIEAICEKTIWLNYGQTKKIGKTRKVINEYLNEQQDKIFSSLSSKKLTNKPYDSKPVVIEKVELVDLEGKVKNEFAFGENMIIRIYYNAKKRIKQPLFNLQVLFKEHGVFDISMLVDGYGPDYIEKRGIVECHLKSLYLTPNNYDIRIFVRSADGINDIAEMKIYARFCITEKNLEKIPMQGPMALNHLRHMPIYIPRTWHFFQLGG
jgi:lipopolysaccharide transport system ATP-binding protein